MKEQLRVVTTKRTRWALLGVVVAGAFLELTLSSSLQRQGWHWEAASAVGTCAAVAVALWLAWRADRHEDRQKRTEARIVAARLSTELHVPERQLRRALKRFEKAQSLLISEPWRSRAALTEAFERVADISVECTVRDLVRLAVVDPGSAEKLSKVNGLLSNLRTRAAGYAGMQHSDVSVSAAEFNLSAARTEVAAAWLSEARKACSGRSKFKFRIPTRWRLPDGNDLGTGDDTNG